MSDKAYDHKQTMDTIVLALRQFLLLAEHVTDEETEQARHALSIADAVGPFVDPTAYRTALWTQSLDHQRKLLAIFTRTKREFLELRDAVLKGGR